MPVRPVNTLWDKDVVSRFQERKVNERDSALSAWRQEGAKAFLQFADARRQFQRRGCAIKPVGVPHRMLVPVIVDGGSIREQYGRTAVNRWSQRAESFRDTDIRMNQLRFPIFGHEEG